MNNWSINNNTLTFVLFKEGKAKNYSFKLNKSNEEKIISLLNEEKFEEIIKEFDIVTRVKEGFKSQLEIIGGNIFFKGELVHNVMVKKIINFIDSGINSNRMLLCLERLLQNPSKHSVEQAYQFIERCNLPITEDGCFLGWKAITHDYKDKYTNSLDYSIGTSHRMDRNKVSDDFNIGCSQGFHVGSLSYAKGFVSGNNRIVIVKFAPEDIVSVPEDCNFQKMRVCAYTIWSEFTDIENKITVNTKKLPNRDSNGRFIKQNK